MKKLVLSIAVMLFGLTAFAQDKQPTKEETIKWLKEKLEMYAKPSFQFMCYEGGDEIYEISTMEITECDITIEWVVSKKVVAMTDCTDETWSYFKQKVKFPTNIKGIFLSSMSSGGRKLGETNYQLYYGDKVIEVYTGESYDTKSKARNSNYYGKEKLESSQGFLNKDITSEMVERIKKAIKHLDTFCPREKEAF